MNVGIIKGYKLERQTSMGLYSDNVLSKLKMTPNVKTFEIIPNTSLKKITIWPVRKFTNHFDRLMRYPIELPQLISKKGIDIFHITDHVNSYLISGLPKHRTVITCHDIIPLLASHGYFERIKISKKSLWHFNYRIKGLKTAAHVIAVSENTKKDLVRFNLCKPDKISVVHAGTNHNYRPYSVEKRRILRSNYNFNDKFVLLHVGSSLFYKNIEGIIEALRILDKFDKFVFLKAGQPFTDHQIDLIERYKLTGKIVHIGAPKNVEEMQDIYNMANSLVFPSHYEGFGWPPLEAMACGIPVICSDKGALGEIVQSAAIICDALSPESLASKIRLLQENSELQQDMICNGLLHFKKFTWEKTMTEELLGIYKRVIQNST